jgi:hypothetical protein
MHTHRPRGLRGRMLHTPRLLTCFDRAMRDETALIVISKGCKGLSTGAVVRNTVLPPGPSSRFRYWRATMALMGLG